MSLAWLPALQAFTMLVAVFASYGIAVGLGHIPAFLPYISDAGVLAPERSVFGFSLCVSAILMLALQVIRFEEVRQSCKKYRQDWALRLLNRISLLLGTLSAAGLVLIANFQTNNYKHGTEIERFNNGTAAAANDGAEVIHKFHWSGAFFTFVIGTAWMFVQSFITLRVAHTAPVTSACCRFWQSKYLTAAGRFCLSMADAFFLVSGVAFVVVEESIGPAAHAQELISSQWSSSYSAGDDLSSSTTAASGVVTSSSYPSQQQQQQQQKQHKSPLSSSSVALGVTAAACEWIVALIIIAFVASFIVEFGRIRLRRGATVAFSVDVVEDIASGSGVGGNVNNAAPPPATENSLENGGLGLGFMADGDGAAVAAASQPLMMSDASQHLPVRSK